MHILHLDTFKEVALQMLWRGAALEQINAFEKAIATLAKQHHIKSELVGSHCSKSIDLPVIRLSSAAGEFTLRDNFHDINLMAVLRSPTTLSLDQFFSDIQEPLSWEWYLEQIKRARNYSWSAWTDEEMNDPQILRVRDKRPGVDLWWDKTSKEKDRWAARLSSPAWHRQDWSSGELTWDGVFGPGMKLYQQWHAYAEGMKVKTSNRKYVKGVSDFIIATNTLENAVVMVERLLGSVTI